MNRYRIARNSVSMLLAMALAMSQVLATVAHAQSSGDSEPPVIDIDPLERSTADRKQVFTARVSDDRTLDAVTLHHRRAGDQAYEVEPMRALGSSGFYTVTIETEVDDLRAIEYYVQARDEAGNRTVNRFSFDPYQREITAAAPVVAQAPPAAEPASEPEAGSSSRKWWAAALGVLVVGAIAAAAGGDSGGGGGGDPDDGVPLTINIQEP